MQEDCALCGSANDKVTECEFDNCNAVFCDDRETFSECCWNRQRKCPDCGRQGCAKHFDGMYCNECRAVEDKELAEAGREGES